MKIRTTNSLKLEIVLEDEEEQRLFFGFAYLDKFCEKRSTSEMEQLDSMTGDLSPRECMDALQWHVANDSLYDGEK